MDNTLTSESSRPCTLSASQSDTDNQKCPQTFKYNQELDPIFGGSTSMNYFLTKNGSIEKASMVAGYTRDALSAKVIGTYKNNLANPLLGTTSDAKLNLSYEAKLSDDLTAVASETVFVSEQQKIPIAYTSALETKYSFNEDYHLYAQGSYSYLQEQEALLSPLSNPYSTTIGVGHTDGSKSSIKALYSHSKGQDPTVKSNKAINLIAKRKIGKKLNTLLTVKKNIEPSLQEDKGMLSIHYAF